MATCSANDDQAEKCSDLLKIFDEVPGLEGCSLRAHRAARKISPRRGVHDAHLPDDDNDECAAPGPYTAGPRAYTLHVFKQGALDPNSCAPLADCTKRIDTIALFGVQP